MTVKAPIALSIRCCEIRVFGEAGAQVVIEDFLRGEEVSFFALSDGISLLPLPSVKTIRQPMMTMRDRILEEWHISSATGGC